MSSKKKIDVITHATKLHADVNSNTINEIAIIICNKLVRIQGIIQRTLQTLNHHRNLNIISNSDIIVCTSTLIECFDKSSIIICQIRESSTNGVDRINQFIDQLQQIIDKLSIIMCGYGAASINDILFISFGTEPESTKIDTSVWNAKHDLIINYVKPIGYKTFHWKQARTKPKYISDQGHCISVASPLCANKMVEDAIQIELSNQYECFDIDFTGKPNYIKIHGIRIVLHNEKTQKTLVIQGIVEDVPIDCIDNEYVKWRKREILNGSSASGEQHDASAKSESYQPDIMRRLIDTMTVKDALVYGNEDFYKKHLAIMTDVNYVKFNKLTTTLRKFLDTDVYGQRSMLTNLLIYNREDDIQYITYLLYDLISAKNQSGSLDSNDQQMIYDSFPWRVKLYFKEAMKNTIKFTKEMSSKYDINRISLEQQIYVMKVPENVREKAMSKLKEIKGKSDDSGAKAKQYLEGLIKIPFGVFREETILKKTKSMNALFVEGLGRTTGGIEYARGLQKSHYSALEISRLCDNYENWLPTKLIESINGELDSLNAKCINQLYSTFVESTVTDGKLATLKQDKIRILKNGLAACDNTIIAKLCDIIKVHTANLLTGSVDSDGNTRSLLDIRKAKQSALELRSDLSTLTDALEESIYGHDHAKNLIGID